MSESNSLQDKYIPIAAKGTAQGAAIPRTNRLLKSWLGDRVLLRLQDVTARKLHGFRLPSPDGY